MIDYKAMTYAELGEILNCTPEAARQFAIRRKLRRVVSNEDGMARVHVDVDDLHRRRRTPVRAVKQSLARTPSVRPPDAPSDSSAQTVAVRIAVLEAELRHAVEQRDQARDQAAVATARAQDLEVRLNEAAARERELVDRLHGVERALRQELQRPWWRRLLGTRSAG
jgi:hypothetical protein